MREACFPQVCDFGVSGVASAAVYSGRGAFCLPRLLIKDFG